MADTQAAIATPSTAPPNSPTVSSPSTSDIQSYHTTVLEAPPAQTIPPTNNEEAANDARPPRSPLLFRPDDEQRKQIPSLDSTTIPRYLFRLYTANSDGITNTTEVTSHFVKERPTHGFGKTDIFSLGRNFAASRLSSHLWGKRGHEDQCNLVSWTSSILFALVYGLYHHKDPGLRHPKLSDIKLLILDTQDFPSGTFVKDVHMISVFSKEHRGLYNLKTLRLGNKYYFGEYLSQGRLDVQGRCAETSLENLENSGVFKLWPWLNDASLWQLNDKGRMDLAKNVVFLRRKLSESLVHESDAREAISIAQQSFGGRWTLPVAAMVLGLAVHESYSEAVIEGFQELLTSDVDKEYLDSMLADDWKLPEVAAFNSIINSLKSAVPGLEDLMEKIHI
ncbi:Fc.00g080760.m01.CDS01 [Cosmosporella sp. VM-42]